MLLTETQREIRDMARDYAREKLAPTAAGRDKKHVFPAAEIREMGQLGFLGMTTPEAYGGSDVGAVAYACVLEEIAAGEGACSTILSVHNSVACGPIVKFGTEAQKQRFLPKLASGEWVGGFALSEPQAGSDAANLLTRAVRDGDHYVLTGTKQLITSGKNGNVIIAFAVTDPAAGKKGISAFIVPTDSRLTLASTGLNISFRDVSPTFVSRDGRPVGLPDTPLGNAFPRGFFSQAFQKH